MKKISTFFKPFEWIYLLGSFACIIVFAILYHNSVFDIIATLCGILAASINLKARRCAFIFYAVYVSIYGITSFFNHIYGEAILNIFYCLPLYLFTIYNLYLNKNKEHSASLYINKLPIKGYIMILIIIPIITIGYGFLLKYLNSTLPFANALATAVALISSFLASKAYKEQWIFWCLYSLVLIFIWLSVFIEKGSNGLVYFILNIIYVGINIYGLIIWQKKYKLQSIEN